MAPAAIRPDFKIPWGVLPSRLSFPRPLHQTVGSVSVSASLRPFEAILIFGVLIQLEIGAY